MPLNRNSADSPLRLTETIPSAPVLLEQDMRQYLGVFREALENRVFGEKTELYGKAYEERAPHLVNAARVFDERTTDGIGAPQVIFDEGSREALEKGMIPVLERINSNTGLSLRGPNFSQAVTNYYEWLGWGVNRVVDRTQKRGMDYWMDGVKGCSDESVGDMENLLRHLKEAKHRVNDEALFSMSPSYRSIDSKRTTTGSEPARHRILVGLQDLVERIVQDEETHDEEKMAHGLLLTTNDLMHYLSQDLGENGLAVIGEKDKRPLNSLAEGPLHQMEAMLSILNPILLDYEECVTLHRDMLLGWRKTSSMRGVASQRSEVA